MTQDFYDSARSRERNLFFSRQPRHDGSTDLLVGHIVRVTKKLPNGSRVLDLGTGNGYLAKRVLEATESKIEIYGVDLSAAMLKEARSQNHDRLHLSKMDNLALKFNVGFFDVVMAKSVRNISVKEVDRVLKPGGHFFYKEYSSGNGLVDVFTHIHKSRVLGGVNIISDLYKYSFNSVKVEYMLVPVRRSKAEVLGAINTMHIASDEKERRSLAAAAEELFKNESFLEILSDPYIIRAQK